MAVGFDSVWVLSVGTLYRVHPGTDAVESFLVLPPAHGIATYALALGNFVWVADSDGTSPAWTRRPMHGTRPRRTCPWAT